MPRKLLFIFAVALPLTAQAADAILHVDTPAQTLYVRIFTNATTSVAVALTEGTSNAVGRYVVSEASLVSDGLSSAGTYGYKIFVGTPSTSAADAMVGQGTLFWSGSVARAAPANATHWGGTAVASATVRSNLISILGTALDDEAAASTFSESIAENFSIFFGILNNGETSTGVGDVGAAEVAETVDADVISPRRTWIAREFRATNIVEVGDNFAGTLALKPDLNPGTTISSVSSVSITGAATVTATDLSVDRSRTEAHFTVPALTTTGTYTVVVTVVTVDNQTIPTTATLKVN